VLDRSVPGYRYGDIFASDKSMMKVYSTKWLDVYKLGYGSGIVRPAGVTVKTRSNFDYLSIAEKLWKGQLDKIAFTGKGQMPGASYGLLDISDYLEPKIFNAGFEVVAANGSPADWYLSVYDKRVKVSADTSEKVNGARSLMIVNSAPEGYKLAWVDGPEIKTASGEVYEVEASVKYRNATWTHMAVEGYLLWPGIWVRLATCPAIKSGTAGWKKYQCSFLVPESVTRIRPRLVGGWPTDTGRGPAVSWFDDVQISKVRPEFFIRLAEEQSVPKVTVEKRSAEQYTVHVKGAKKPFLLVFGEAYDALWQARVSGGKKVDPVPLYSLVNGFPIDRTGDYDVTISYQPQSWFVYGLVISALAYLLGLLYFVYYWRRHRKPRDVLQRGRDTS
jgi:hypothetical protein